MPQQQTETVARRHSKNNDVLNIQSPLGELRNITGNGGEAFRKLLNIGGILLVMQNIWIFFCLLYSNRA